MEEEKTVGLVETFDTGELSTELIPPNFTDPDDLFEILKKTVSSYHPSNDLEMINKAYELAKDAHKDQKRKSGEPYLIHPVCVAIILAQLEMDKETIVGGLLHDVVEDTEYDLDYIRREFGDEVALLVDGVTKLTKIPLSTREDVQAENIRKMFIAMNEDVRVIIIKLCDRLHNMRTLQHMPPYKQREKSLEVLEIYAPIAHRLGIRPIKEELEDLAIYYLDPIAYKEIEKNLSMKKEQGEKFLADITKQISDKITPVMKNVQITSRVKSVHGIFRKVYIKGKDFEQIFDIYAVRIIVDTMIDCYNALGIVHDMFKPLPGRFKDYISMPKPNMYQSLHTTLISQTGQPFEIQIRTYEMHRTAEYGIAAHWKYKENIDGTKGDDSEEAKLTWLRQILEWQRDMSDNKEFLSIIKSDLDLFSDSVYCFTPQGDVKNLPAGSTPIDFAYSIHSAVGNKMVGAKVNGKLVPIDYKIKNGDRIEVITSQNSKGPSRDWLKVVKSPQAKNKINSWFKAELKEDNILKGKDLIHNYCKTKNIVLSDLLKPEFIEKTMTKYGFRDWDSVLAAVGHGGLKEGQVVGKLQEEYDKKHREEITDADILADNSESTIKQKDDGKPSKTGIIVKGIHDVAVRFSKCCNPVPGDEIVGFVTRGRGISIHTTDCINVINMSELDKSRLIDAEWQKLDYENSEERYTTDIKIYANNRTGLIVDISKILTERKIDVKTMNCRTSKTGTATLELSFEISGVDALRELFDKLRNVEGVLDIERTRG